jgi:outer membrane receptor protein involved in Fe transport
MNPMSLRRLGGACLVLLGIAVARAVAAQSPTPVPTPRPTPVAAIAPAPQEVEPVNEQVVVSSTKIAQEPIDIPGNITVVSGDEVRRRGTTTLAQALQDVVGLDTGEGSDNGPRLPNIGLYGIKEFDALMVTVDGVPVGGPFNPNLAQVPVENRARSTACRRLPE